MRDDLTDLEASFEKWNETSVKKAKEKTPELKPAYYSDSRIEIKPVYSPLDFRQSDYEKKLSFPGQFPYTRGIYPLMYRTRQYTMRHYSGWGAAEDTNRRWKYLLEHGETGLSLANDLPTQMGFDPDDPLVEGEVGRVGASICNKEDYRVLYDGIPMDTTSISLQANANSIFMVGFHYVEGMRRGLKPDQLWGTCQNDILKEFISRGTWIFPIKESVRVSCDVMEYAARNMGRWAPLSICSYHLQEAGADFATSMAFSMCNAIEYIQELLRRGLNIDDFAYFISTWDISCNINFFEMIYGMRASRRLWARLLKEKYHAKDPKSWMMRIFVGSGGIQMTRAEPINNIVRGTISAIAAALAGVQSINIQCYDESYSIPTEEAQRVALRTEQIVADETDIMSTVDPLGGSYFIESLTDQIEKKMEEIIDNVLGMGGALEAIKSGYMQRIITSQSYRRQRSIESGELVRVGENKFQAESFEPIPEFQIDPRTEKNVVKRLGEFKKTRNATQLNSALSNLKLGCQKENENLMPHVLRAISAGATVGEMASAMKQIMGEGREVVLL
ncbi:MAG: methylmalonyl-CoA mutase family protein [Thaumarchaeota archaeon]|nr:methylmalonyl-CoA mutase family protein [Nitrososphaerota archaeon]